MSVEIEVAQDVGHALSLLSSGDDAIRPVAGATDVILRLHAGRLKARKLVSIADLPELAYVQAESGHIKIGAGTCLSDVMAHPQVQSTLPILVEAGKEFASPQIRNRATLGGNLGNASPAADMVAPLIALGALATVRSHRAQRTVPVEALFLGMGRTLIAPDELITELQIPADPRFQAFRKFGSRNANVISVVNMALALSFSGTRIVAARVAFGSVAPKPLRAEMVEQALVGSSLDASLPKRIGEVVRSQVSPIDDVRGSKRYKTHLAVVALEDALDRALLTLQA